MATGAAIDPADLGPDPATYDVEQTAAVLTELRGEVLAARRELHAVHAEVAALRDSLAPALMMFAAFAAKPKVQRQLKAK